MAGRNIDKIAVGDVRRGAALDVLSVPLAAYRVGTLFSITGDGKKFAYRADGASRVRIQDVAAGRVSLLEVPDDTPTALAFSLDGQMLATAKGFGDGAIRLWDAQNQPLGTLEGHRAW